MTYNELLDLMYVLNQTEELEIGTSKVVASLKSKISQEQRRLEITDYEMGEMYKEALGVDSDEE